MIQRHLLPAGLPEVEGYRFAVHYRPCEAAGGDYYGFQPFGGDSMGFVVADVSGHGVGAAVMMAVLRAGLAAFKVFDRTIKYAPQDINAIVNECRVPGIFVTAVFTSIHFPTGLMHIGNCGHPPPRILRGCRRLEYVRCESSLPMGIEETIDPPAYVAELGRGDSVVFYTDGITETRNGRGEMFDDARLDAAILEGAGDATRVEGRSERIVEKILEALAGFDGGLPAPDDRCILVCTRL